MEPAPDCRILGNVANPVGWAACCPRVQSTPDVRVGNKVAHPTLLPEKRTKIADLGAEIVISTPEQFAAYIKTETAKSRRLG